MLNNFGYPSVAVRIVRANLIILYYCDYCFRCYDYYPRYDLSTPEGIVYVYDKYTRCT